MPDAAPRTCAACGFVAVHRADAACAQCGWIADPLQLAQPDLTIGANHGTSLREAQASALARWPWAQRSAADRERDPRWRPLEADETPPASDAGCASSTCLAVEPQDDTGAEPEPYWLRSPRVPPAIRAAQPAEAARLSALACESKAYWGYADRWIDAWRDALTLTPQYVAANPVFVAEAGGEIVGFHALLPGDEVWQLDHLWLHPAAIGGGLGRRLFAHAAGYAAAHGASALSIDAEPYAEPFYLHVGAVRVGEVRADLDDVPRVRPQMRLELPAR